MDLVEKKNLIRIIVFSVVLRLFTFVIVLLSDSELWIEASKLLFSGINPYETEVEFFYKYPPLFYYILSFFGLLTNFSYLSPKLMIFAFDISNILIIYKIGEKLKNNQFGIICSLLYALNPIIIMQFYHDVNEFVALFFTLLSVYFLIHDYDILTALSLGFGIAFKLYPIFFLMPLTIFWIKNRKNWFKKILLCYSSIFLLFIVLSIPFLLNSPEIYIQKLFIHTRRRNLGDSITEQIPQLLILYNEAFNLFGISFSYQFLIQALSLLAIFTYFCFFRKKFKIYDFFLMSVIISIILPLINYQIQLKYTYLIAFPFLLFIINDNQKQNPEPLIFILFILNLFSILLFIILYSIFLPPINNLISAENLVIKGSLYGIFWVSCFCVFLIIRIKVQNFKSIAIHLLNVLPFIFYNLFSNFLGAFLAIVTLFFNFYYFLINYS